MAIYSFLHWDEQSARKILVSEVEIDNMEKALRINHIKRLNEGTCNPSSGVIFLDMLSNLERIGDHSFNIASYVLILIKTIKIYRGNITKFGMILCRKFFLHFGLYY